MQIADSLLDRNISQASKDGIMRAIELFDGGDREAAEAAIAELSEEDAARAIKIMMAHERSNNFR